MRKILCYGDSNTWGYIPGSFDLTTGLCKKYTQEECWPGILTRNMGDDLSIIVDGLNGRTTNLDETGWADRNGLAHISHILESQAPIDIVIIMLGTNDLKFKFQRSASEIAHGVEEIIRLIKSFKCLANQEIPNIVIMSPPALTSENSFGDEFKNAIRKNNDLPSELREISFKNQCFFVDASDISPSPLDGVHLDVIGHSKLAERIIPTIQELCARKLSIISTRKP